MVPDRSIIALSIFSTFLHCFRGSDAAAAAAFKAVEKRSICGRGSWWNFGRESCYYVLKVSPDEWRPYTRLTMDQYRRACELLNATLPIIGREEEQEFLTRLTKHGTGLFNAFDYYLGIIESSVSSTTGRSDHNDLDDQSKSSWRWQDGSSTEKGYLPNGWSFDPSYPCVTFGWTGWRNDLCWQFDSGELYAVCERPYSDSGCEAISDLALC